MNGTLNSTNNAACAILSSAFSKLHYQIDLDMMQMTAPFIMMGRYQDYSNRIRYIGDGPDNKICRVVVTDFDIPSFTKWQCPTNSSTLCTTPIAPRTFTGLECKSIESPVFFYENNIELNACDFHCKVNSLTGSTYDQVLFRIINKGMIDLLQSIEKSYYEGLYKDYKVCLPNGQGGIKPIYKVGEYKIYKAVNATGSTGDPLLQKGMFQSLQGSISNNPYKLSTHGSYLFVDNAFYDQLVTTLSKQTTSCCSLLTQTLGASKTMRSFYDDASGITVIAVRDEFLRYTSVGGEFRPVYPLVNPSMYHILPLGVESMPDFIGNDALARNFGQRTYQTIVMNNSLFPMVIKTAQSDIRQNEGLYIHMKAGGASLALSTLGINYLLGQSRAAEADFATFGGSVDFLGLKINTMPVVSA